MKLFPFFNKKKEPNQSSMLQWEENYLMIELVSRENLYHATQEMKRLDPSAQHFIMDENAELNNGTQASPKDTFDLHIDVSELGRLLETIGMTKFDKLTSITGSVIDSSLTIAYGEHKNGLFIDKADEIVKHIWLEFYSRENLPSSLFVEGLNRIGEEYAMILVDWQYECIVDLKDKKAIQDYLSHF